MVLVVLPHHLCCPLKCSDHRVCPSVLYGLLLAFWEEHPGVPGLTVPRLKPSLHLPLELP